MVAALDFYTLFVDYVFGNFLLAVVGLALVMFIILSIGRVSIWTLSWYIVMFVLSMSLGYGSILINIIITLMILVGFIFAWRNYLDK